MRDLYTDTRPRVEGICDEPTCCGAIPEGRRSKRSGFARFCSTKCRQTYERRRIKRGVRLYEAAIAWRAAPRKHSKGAQNPPTNFGDVTGLIDEFLAEDRAMREETDARKRAHTQYQDGWAYAVQNETSRDIPEWVDNGEWVAGFADAQHYLDNRYVEL